MRTMLARIKDRKQPNVKINLIILATLIAIGGLCLLAGFIYDVATYHDKNQTSQH